MPRLEDFFSSPQDTAQLEDFFSEEEYLDFMQRLRRKLPFQKQVAGFLGGVEERGVAGGLEKWREFTEPTPIAGVKLYSAEEAKILASNIGKQALALPRFPVDIAQQAVKEPLETAKQLAQYPLHVLGDYMTYISPLSSPEQRREAIERIAEDPLGLFFAVGITKGGLKGGQMLKGAVKRTMKKKGLPIEEPPAEKVPPITDERIQELTREGEFARERGKPPAFGEAELRLKRELEPKLKEKPVTEKPAEIPKGTEVIKPEEKLGGGLGALWPFKSKQEQFALKLRQMTEKRKLQAEIDQPSPTITMDLRVADARTFVQRPSHKYGAVPDEFGQVKANYGMAAAEAQKLLMLTERNIRRDQGMGLAEISNTLKKTTRRNLGKYEQDIIDGLETPIGATEVKGLPKDVVDVIRDLKVLSDRQRGEIIKIKRNDIRKSFTKLAEKKYRQENNLQGKRLTPEQKGEINELAEGLVRREIPDDWGIQDYFRHLHLGDYQLFREGAYFGSARNWPDALAKTVESYVENPSAKYDIKLRDFLDPDVVRVSRKRQYKILNDLRKELNEESTQRIQDVLRGKIGAREAKRKWAGFLQERKGAPGYMRDLRFVLNYHNNQFHRWKNLYKLQSQVQPLISKIKNEGRHLVAEEVEANLNALWGKKTKVSIGLDNLNNKVFGEGRIRPFALERWTGRAKNLTTTLMLKTSARYNLLNSMQILQTGMVVPYRNLAWAQKAVRSAEGKALLDRHGVYYSVTGIAGELIKIYTPVKWRAGKVARTLRLSPETSNQAEMWLAVYKHGRDALKMSDVEAGDYAFLRGQIYSQFLPLKTNIPRALKPELMRAGPGMYRTFNIGAIELSTDLAKKAFGKGYTPRERIPNIGRLSHFVLAQLALGGTKIATGPVGKLGIGGYLTAKIYNQIKDEYGETTANVVNWGLPALINSDWSLSVQLLDAPFADNVPEAIGEVLLGPMGGTALRITTQALANDGEEDSRVWRAVNAATQKFGGTRQLLGLEKVLTGDYDFKSPNGKLQFKGDLKDALVQMYGSRPLKSAIQSMNFDAMAEVWGKRNNALNSAERLMRKFREETGGKYLNDAQKQAVMERLARFNAEWPEVAIAYADVTRRADGRDEVLGLSAFERALKAKGKRFEDLFEAGLP